MTTIVNSPNPPESKGGIVLVITIFILIVFGILFYYFGIPAIKRIGSGQNITPEIVIPDKIDVNVNQN